MKYLVLLVFLLLSGCFQDGKNGKVYFAVCWVNLPQTLSIYDTAIPSTVYNHKYYLTSSGTYSYSSKVWDGTTYNQSYTLSANAGTKGSLFTDGTDGADNFYQLYLYGAGVGGPSIYLWSYAYEDTSWTGSSMKTVYIMNENEEVNTKKYLDQMNGLGNDTNTIFINMER